MAIRTLPLQVPEELVALLGTPEAVTARAKEALVLDLVRQARIGQSKAAELLGITRGALLDLMAEHRIPSGAETAAELATDLASARRHVTPR
jgi:predicted XRE-type DNA-binding protein